MITRVLQSRLIELSRRIPAVVVTGPRQSGKTTLCRAAFPEHRYVSLEPLDTRDFAESDPRGFLGDLDGPAVLDEVQRAPSLFSYLQEEIDRDPAPGRFVLTGSQHFGLTDAIAQSLAGRVAILHLLPVSLDELRRFRAHPEDLWSVLWAGSFPRIHDKGLEPDQWLSDYVATYVQRDVRQVLRVGDLSTFTAFLRLLAGRTAQEENLSALGSDAGIAHPTARSWLSVLETGFVVFRLPRWHRNLRKRVVKSAKVHFLDTGMACHLLGIRSPEQLATHPLRGAVFESWVAAEILKARLHRGRPADLFHLREARGIEIDLLVESAVEVTAVEAKSGATVGSDFLDHLHAFADGVRERHPELRSTLRLLYGGEREERRSRAHVLPWGRIQDVAW